MRESKSSWAESYGCKDLHIMWGPSQFCADTHKNTSGRSRSHISALESGTPIIFPACICIAFSIVFVPEIAGP